jgi:hypothetical protein
MACDKRHYRQRPLVEDPHSWPARRNLVAPTFSRSEPLPTPGAGLTTTTCERCLKIHAEEVCPACRQPLGTASAADASYRPCSYSAGTAAPAGAQPADSCTSGAPVSVGSVCRRPSNGALRTGPVGRLGLARPEAPHTASRLPRQSTRSMIRFPLSRLDFTAVAEWTRAPAGPQQQAPPRVAPRACACSRSSRHAGSSLESPRAPQTAGRRARSSRR